MLKWSKQYVIPISGDGAAMSSDGSDSSVSPRPSSGDGAAMSSDGSDSGVPQRPSSGDGAAMSSDGSDSSVPQSPSSATPKLAARFPTRNAVLRALHVIETAHEHLQKEQTFGFFRTRRLCQNILQSVTDVANPVHRQLRQHAETLYQENWKSIKREREERTTMAADIAGLQRMVIWSNQYLPSWWT